MLVTLKEVLTKAKDGKYAVGAFNTTSLEAGMAIVEAAEELRAPVILQYTKAHSDLIELDVIGPIMLQLAKAATVPVVVHLDHGATVELCKQAIDMGFTSVMIDASALPFEENVATTKEVVKYAHSKGASVEAELGHILTSSLGAAEGAGGKSYSREEAYTDPQEAKKFVEQTNVDALAIGFGTAHGVYTEKPILALDRITMIKNVIDHPFVMHGGSGLSDDEYRQAIKNGITKVNYYTYLSLAGAKAAREVPGFQEGNGNMLYFEDFCLVGKDAMKENVKHVMSVYGCAGKADDVCCSTSAVLDLVTEAEINDAYRNNRRTVYCCEKAIITDAARERAISTGIEIIKR